MRRSTRAEAGPLPTSIDIALILATGYFPLKIQKVRAATPQARRDILRLHREFSLALPQVIQTLHVALRRGKIEREIAPAVRKFLAYWEAQAARV
ncbi:MAG: hypothetical protein ABSA41_17085 [Terriglobia bacterium]|jgi:hypothetical protein